MTAVLLLFLAGVILIFSEFFIPGITMGVVGGVLIILSIGLGWQRFPEYGIFILAGDLFGVVLIIGLGLFLLATTPLGRGFVMKAKQDVAEGYSSHAQDPAMLGKVVTVHTALRPAGSILVGAQRVDAVSNGTFIDAGKSVRIIRVEGHRVVCEEAAAETSGPSIR